MGTMTRLAAVVLALAPLAAWAAPPAQPTPETLDFLTTHAGAKAALTRDGIGAVFGVPLAEDSDGQTTTKQFVDAFLITQDNVDILGKYGVLGDDLVFDNELVISNGKFAVLTYTQKVTHEADLQMHGGLVKVLVLLGATEKIVHIGSTLRHEPESALPGDVESSQDALDTASAAYSQLNNWSTPEKVVYQAPDNSHHRAWRFDGWSDTEAYLFFVDTNSGALIDVVSTISHGDPVSGTVMGFASPGLSADDPDDPASTPVEKIMPGVTVTFQGFPSVNALDDGTYTINDLSGPPMPVKSTLVGDWVLVDSDSDYSGVDDLEAIVDDVTPPQACASPPGDCVDPVFNSPTQTTGNTAQVNAYLAAKTTHDWYKQLQPNFTGIDEQLQVVTNTEKAFPTADACNPYYQHPVGIFLPIPDFVQICNGTEIDPDGCQCFNSAMTTWVTHEYGHFLQRRLFGFSSDFSMGEALSDTLTALLRDTHCIGENYYRENHPKYDREGDHETCARRYDGVAINRDYHGFMENDCSNGCNVELEDLRCNSPHCEGLALAGAFWDLRETIFCCSDNGVTCKSPEENCSINPCSGSDECIDAATERIFADFLAVTTGRLDQRTITEILVVDDDDGDLRTASPHQQQILNAFVNDHGWADPTAADDVVVKWNIAGGGPNDPGDFEVNYGIFPPAVTLKALEDGSGIPVLFWEIGRLIEVTPGIFVAGDIGIIDTDWPESPPDTYDITVFVGTTPATLCRDLVTLDILAQDGSNYSNVELDLLGSVIYSASCDVSGTRGGRIGGQIGGNAGSIEAYGIGSGEDDQASGDLIIGKNLSDLQITTIADDSKLEVGGITGLIDLTGDLDVTESIVVQGDMVGELQVDGSMSGNIHATGSILGPITIGGDVSGEIVADFDEVNGGVISGVVTINGVFTGEICDADMRAGGGVPSNVQVSLPPGPGATVCGLPLECFTDAHCTGCGSQGTATCGMDNLCHYTCLPDDVCPPCAASSPYDVRKNRYLSFVPVGGADPIAYRVVLTDSLQFPNPVVTEWWVCEPDAEGIAAVDPDPLVCPARSWDDWSVVHVTGCPIVPVSKYDIYGEVDPDCSDPLAVETILKPGIKYWGDVVGSFNGIVWSAPQGAVNVDDMVAAIKTFQEDFFAPHKSITDVQPQDLNKIVNIADVLFIILGFQGKEYPFGCPADLCQNNLVDQCPGRAAWPQLAVSTLSLLPSADLIDQQDTINVEVFLDLADNLGGYQLDLVVTGGDTGSLDLVNLFIDETRCDYAFSQVSNAQVYVSTARGQLAAADFDGDGIAVGPTYLGTFQFLASNDATGVFQVSFDTIGDNFLMNGNGHTMTDTITVDPIYIGCEVACAIDGHCDDSNPCTDDTCNNGTCVYTNDDTNSCSDGTECTDDSCSSGTCVGVNDDTNSCSDGNECTDDSCSSGVCVGVDDDANSCDDGNECRDYSCSSGFCLGIIDDTNSCSDGNECTDDSCSAGACSGVNDDTNFCSDGNGCTDDACSSGVCVSTNDDTNGCGDGNKCTDNSCSSGVCVSVDDDTNNCGTGNPCIDKWCCSGVCYSAIDDTNTCTDANDCTADVCDSGVCNSTNEPATTPCDDGFFCTATDECDGSGTCVGSGDPCPPRNPVCCEYVSTCGSLPCS